MLALGEMCFEGRGAVEKGFFLPVQPETVYRMIHLLFCVCTAYICGVGLYTASSRPSTVYYLVRVLPSLGSLRRSCTKAMALAPSVVCDCYLWSLLLIKFFPCTER